MPLTVFLIEHDPAVRDSLTVALEAAGLLVRAFESMTAFIDDFEPVQPACLVLDLDGPDTDGSALLDCWTRLPTVVTSARLSTAGRHHKLPVPCRLLRKPFGDVELIAEIEGALAGSAAAGPAGPGPT